MFTGIIKEVGKVAMAEPDRGGRRIRITAELSGELAVDQSISVNGVCHTVVECDGSGFAVQSVEETLRKTNIGNLEKGDPVNLERSVTAERLLDGHIVQGHVDATGRIEAIVPEGSGRLVTVSYPREHRALLVGRGSISVDGISLTVADLSDDTFTFAVIPYTFAHTNLSTRQAGDRVNLEFDIFGKYVARYLETRE